MFPILGDELIREIRGVLVYLFRSQPGGKRHDVAEAGHISDELGGEEIARLEIDLESGGRDEVMAGKLRLFLQDPPVGGTEQLVTLGDAYVIDIRVIGGDDPDFIYGGFVAFDEGGLVDCT